ncbi:hypothetical protein GCM10023350_28540 [Nocardioides endophyticus]|uniref:Twin-arginine translocation signal domain-containing protein n=1 Tax=Nocardioides endophyticus TaxID=1353775 RepID=A0ABP8YZF5_9ACTN
MTRVETFAHAGSSSVSRRRVLKVLGATVAAASVAGLGDGLLTPAVPAAAALAWQPPPAYDRIVGLL